MERKATGRGGRVLHPGLRRETDRLRLGVLQVDGHGITETIEAIERAAGVKGTPCRALLDAIKGKSFSFAEGTAANRNGTFDDAAMARAYAELEAAKAALAATA